MTYHLEPWIEKITSPVTLIYPDGERQEYRDGKEITNHAFAGKHKIGMVCAVDGKIEIELLPSEQLDSEESFF